MNWALGSLLFFSGAVLGYLLHWRQSAKTTQQNPSATQELVQARFELDQQRQEVADYFEQSRALMLQLGKDLEKANQFWNESATELLGEDKVVPLTAPSETNKKGEDGLPPNDYVQGSHGIIGQSQQAQPAGDEEVQTQVQGEEPPNDYVQGSHGIIGEPPKAANG